MSHSALMHTPRRQPEQKRALELAAFPSIFPPTVSLRGRQERGQVGGLGGDEDDALNMYLRDMGHIPLLTEAQERSLAERIGRGDQGAQRQLVEANLRLVVSVAKKYKGHGISLDDLIGEGNLGLIHAAGLYDGARNCRFGTYAFWWIHQAISRAVEEKSTPLHIPSYAHRELRLIKRARSQFLHLSGLEPQPTDLVEATGIGVERIEELLRAANATTSLNEPMYGEEEHTSLGDLLPDTEADAVEEIVIRDSLQKEFDEALKTVLTERERLVIRFRHGLTDSRSHSLEEIGRRLRVSRERVRQIEAGAIEKLKHSPLLRRLYRSL